MTTNLIKPLKKPWKVGGKEATEIEVRPATMKDVCEAEQSASAFQPNSFNVQMACLQVVRAGDFTGPFVASHFNAMSPARFAEITAAMKEADQLGGRLVAKRRELLSQVMLLALKFHWSREEILNLHPAEFQFYVTELATLLKPDNP